MGEPRQNKIKSPRGVSKSKDVSMVTIAKNLALYI